MEPSSAQRQAFMDFLNDDLLFSGVELLDASTLAAAVCAVEPQQSGQQRKRSRAADDVVKEEPEEEEDSAEEKGGECSKRSKADHARSKACREKARREKLNDRWGT
jgi:hypothetical protein